MWNSLGIRAALSQIHFLGLLMSYKYKMNETINKFLLAGDKFLSEMHLRQPGVAGDSRYVYQNKLDKACFQHDMAYRIL